MSFNQQKSQKSILIFPLFTNSQSDQESNYEIGEVEEIPVRAKKKGNYIICLTMLFLSQPCLKTLFNLATKVFEVLKLKICSKFTGEHSCQSATLMKSHLDMAVFLYICSIFSEHLFKRASLKSCFCQFYPSQASQMHPDFTHICTSN